MDTKGRNKCEWAQSRAVAPLRRDGGKGHPLSWMLPCWDVQGTSHWGEGSGGGTMAWHTCWSYARQSFHKGDWRRCGCEHSRRHSHRSMPLLSFSLCGTETSLCVKGRGGLCMTRVVSLHIVCKWGGGVLHDPLSHTLKPEWAIDNKRWWLLSYHIHSNNNH